MNISKLTKAIILSVFAFSTSYATADANFPNKPIKIVVPFAPGGLPDTVARIVSESMQNTLKQPVVVDNKPGGGGATAVATLQQSPADGYNLLISDGPTLSIAPLIIANLGYNPEKDLEPIAIIGVAPLYLAASERAPFTTMEEMIKYAKANPGKLNYGSSGVGSIHHLTAEAMKQALGLDIEHVPYKGSSASVPALIGNQVDMTFASPPSLMGFAKAGKAKVLATNTLNRTAQEPNVPAISEFAKDFNFGFSVVLMSRKGTPEAIKKKLIQSVEQALEVESVKSKLLTAGVEPNSKLSINAESYIKDERNRVVQAAKLAELKAQ